MIYIALGIIGLLVTLLCIVSCVRTLYVRRKHRITRNLPQMTSFDDAYKDELGNHLAGAVSFPTIARGIDESKDQQLFFAFHTYLAQTYPLLFTRLERIDVGEPRNLVFVWRGSQEKLEPALLTAHQDVVPADDSRQWTYPPFDRTIADGYVWGRGSFDAKGQLIAICEAIEELITQRYTPVRTWYIAFGCDEETRGTQGAYTIARYFQKKGIRFAFVLDEGGVVAQGFIPQVSNPMAVIGIVEKGNSNIRLSCHKEGGHSSSPKNPTALASLGRAVWRIESKKPPAQITSATRLLMTKIGCSAPFLLALPLLNLWLFKPIVLAIFSSSPTMNSLIRSTIAVTMAEGSHVANVIPVTAQATVNVRLLPGESTELVAAWMHRIIRDKDIKIEVIAESERSRPSSVDSEPFQAISEAIIRTFPEAIPTPYMMMGATDALQYELVSDYVYRFTPALMNTQEVQRMHNIDERFSLENLGKAAQFYTTLIKQDSLREDM